jgi:hypothetical protein
MLRRVWQEQYTGPPEPVAWRPVKALATTATLVASPYDSDARWRTKRGMEWAGYKVHLTATCDPDTPNLIVDVQTTPATTPDDNMLVPIHARLARRALLTSTHLVAGFASKVNVCLGPIWCAKRSPSAAMMTYTSGVSATSSITTIVNSNEPDDLHQFRLSHYPLFYVWLDDDQRAH